METPQTNAQPTAAQAEKKSKKEKTPIVPNECPVWRWALAIVFALIFGYTFLFILSSALKLLNGIIAPENYEITEGLIQFTGLYLGFVLSLRVFAKTRIRDFIFGIGGKFNRQEAGTVALLTIIGLIASGFITINTVTLNPTMTLPRFCYIFIMIFLFLWMQTSWEEFIFRGLFIRIFHKNNISIGVKSIVIGIISSLLFMSLHLANPEVTSQSGIDIFLMATTYALSGFLMYYCDLYYKNLMPGMVIHLVNNAFCFLILSAPNSVMGGTTIFFDNAPQTGLTALISEVILIVPFIVYFIISSRKKKTLQDS